MTLEDICFTLNHLRMLDIHDRVPTPRPLPGQSIKSSKSRKSGVARKALQRTTTHDDDRVKGPFVPPASYAVSWDPTVVEGYMSKWESKGYLKLKPQNLKWSPFLIARTMKSDGLPVESELGSDAVPPSATDSVTPSLDTPNTPRPRTSDRLNALRTSETPAHALFDDDDIEFVRPSSSVLPVLGAGSEPSSSRRGRSNSPAGSDSTPIRKRPRRSTTLASTPRTRPDRPLHVRRTRSVAQLPQLRDEADLIAEDAALAARLAMEEGRQRRQLRSRSNTEQEHQRPISPSTPKTTNNSRKRKRANTPPPPASPVSTRHTRSQGAVAPVVEPPAAPRRPSNKSPSKKRRPEGRKRDRERERKRRREQKRLEQQQRLAGTSTVPEPELEPEQEQEPPRSPTPSPSAGGDAIVESPAAMDTKMEDAPHHMGLLAPESAAKEDDTQVEDMDTPSAGATSRQSVGHSDDTVYATEEPPVQHKVSPVPVVAPTKASNGVPPQAVPNGHADLALAGDADADAEGDVDAEGEPDEGEEDVDAEGEPDNGDDDIDIDIDEAY